jgi:hypothetical protein
MGLIATKDQALNNIERLEKELDKSPELVGRLGFVHAWYVDTRDKDRPRFGFSKFIGYKSLDGQSYLKNSNDLDGRYTEWALKDFFEELRPGSSNFEKYYEALVEWLNRFGKTPRKTVRLMVLRQDMAEVTPGEDRRLLDLMIATADLLSVEQRHELRNRL